MAAVPVIALTGHLGAGKTTLLNHLLRHPRTRIGVVVNDFGDINIDAALVAGQVDEPASIAGGCICCLPDGGGLDDALIKLANPARRLDAIVVEASGLADPVAIARIIGFSEIRGVRPGGLVDVVDAVNHFDTVDCGALPPVRYGAASLIVVNKIDQVPEGERAAMVQRVTQRAAQRNPRIHVVATTGGRIAPELLFDASATSGRVGQLSFLDLAPEHDHDHVHADAVAVCSSGCVDPNALFDLLEDPPPRVFRLKGIVAVRHRATVHGYVVNLVGSAIHIGPAPRGAVANRLVAIGMDLDVDAVRARVDSALQPAPGRASAQALRRLDRYRRLSA
ncbi:cobalamin biosynthesis protein CobW [Mycobacterium sp. E1715]|uniref:CobW family GTP-binding protein n=1 Tax=unclassified Mycobacterium TaxID=2642494 RepID=UPI0007FDFEB1|nr:MULTISPECIES: GTP-binding protein [unclassified Mycobacterium]OBG59616.1 cobalamin biosynthesis protein CobW [Mycobacterium sp. E188]OBH11596.1 cobalamin biosynthesis protein CobW [Mycobacterium sp. E1715]OBH39989.1 cobalamin biosynthesis protein CobW [Mycobacterium sp. E183]